MRQHRFWSRAPRVVIVLGVLGLTLATLSPSVLWTSGLAAAAPRAAAAQPFILSSPAFHDGGPLPLSAAFNKLGCPGSNIAPTLNWRGVPAGTESFAFALNDYDAPVAGGFHHWVVYNISENVRSLNGHSPFTQGMNDFGFTGYGGPCPPATGQIHHYVFTLYALTIEHISGKALTYNQLIAAINGHVAGATVVIGTFVLPL